MVNPDLLSWDPFGNGKLPTYHQQVFTITIFKLNFHIFQLIRFCNVGFKRHNEFHVWM